MPGGSCPVYVRRRLVEVGRGHQVLNSRGIFAIGTSDHLVNTPAGVRFQLRKKTVLVE